MNNKENKENKETEELLNLARDEKISEEEVLKESIAEKNKIIAELEEKNKELNKQILYLKAEFDNYRKRVEKEKQQKFLLGKISILEKLISLYEMFALAIKSIKNNEQKKNNDNISQVIEGIKILYKEIENFLLKEGVKRIDCINQQFNPTYHEVVDYKETDNSEEQDKIIEVVSDGYVFINDLEEYVLRPAKVIVTKLKKIEIDETQLSSDASNQNGSGNE